MKVRIKTKSGAKLKGLPFAGRDLVAGKPTYWIELETAEDIARLPERFGYSILMCCVACQDGHTLLIVADDYLD